MDLKCPCVRLLHLLNNDLAEVDPLFDPFVSLLKLKVLAIRAKHAHQGDFNKEVGGLLHDVNLVTQ